MTGCGPGRFVKSAQVCVGFLMILLLSATWSESMARGNDSSPSRIQSLARESDSLARGIDSLAKGADSLPQCTENSAQCESLYPRDTSFTPWSAWQKIRSDFPHAVLVREFEVPDAGSLRNVVYKNTGSRELVMDIFSPGVSPDNPRPVVICIHGGGWASGNRSHLVPLAQALSRSGYLTAAIEYRLSPEALYPAAIEDITDAVRWLHRHAASYGIDTSKTALLGTSAGATLASLVGVTHPEMVQAIMNIDGILDFSDPAESGKDTDPSKPSAAARWFGATYKEAPELWHAASPLTYVGKDTPPTLFINSSIPRFHAGRDAFLETLDTHGIYSRVHTITETPHPFWLFHPWFDTSLEYIGSFLEAVF